MANKRTSPIEPSVEEIGNPVLSAKPVDPFIDTLNNSDSSLLCNPCVGQTGGID